ncbi:saccharopine dehydrogenase family protein [Candidatus Bathyarchaeota archaeon]|nr:MAG: saccharopine dehydrogenase family protein [Candidatus Bathyarchaeota archaeon]
MRVLVLGCGNIGSVIARDFAESMEESQIVVADREEERAKKVASSIEDAAWITVDATDYAGLVEVLRGFDLVIGALPGDYGYQALKAAIEAGVDMVDVSFTPEDPLELDRAAKEAGVTIIPDCGVAPGLSNMLVGYASAKLDRVLEAHILVGGLPEHPVPPLGYTVTWSAEGLIDEYMRDVRIVEGGRLTIVPALSGLEEIDFPGVGRLEAFYTDGLRTLLHTLRGVESMWEKTLRYPGHVEKIRLLKALGFFDEEPVTVGRVEVSPRLVTARLLERSLRRPEVGDLLVMRVEVAGERGGEEVRFRYYLLDRYDRERGVTAMARTTAYTASIVAGKLARSIIKERGIVPPERLGMDEGLFKEILSALRDRGVRVEEFHVE